MSSGDNSVHRPFSGLYTCVPLMMTVCAGRFTPHASVAVDTSTCTWPPANRSSTSLRSARAMPAWWMAKPYGSTSFRSASATEPAASAARISRAASSRMNLATASAAVAMSRSARAVLAVSLRLCTKMSTWLPLPACSTTLSYVISFMSWKRFTAFFSVMPTYCCWSGQGRKELSKWNRPEAGLTRRKAATSS